MSIVLCREGVVWTWETERERGSGRAGWKEVRTFLRLMS